MTLLEINFQRRKAKGEATRMLDTALLEGRPLTIAEQIRFDGLAARIQDLDNATAERQALRKMVK